MRAWFYTLTQMLTQMHSYALFIGCETQLGSLNSFKSIEWPEESEVYTSRLEWISLEINEEQLIALRIVAPTSFVVQPVINNTLLIYQHVVHRKEVVDEFSIVNLA